MVNGRLQQCAPSVVQRASEQLQESASEREEAERLNHSDGGREEAGAAVQGPGTRVRTRVNSESLTRNRVKSRIWFCFSSSLSASSLCRQRRATCGWSSWSISWKRQRRKLSAWQQLAGSCSGSWKRRPRPTTPSTERWLHSEANWGTEGPRNSGKHLGKRHLKRPDTPWSVWECDLTRKWHSKHIFRPEIICDLNFPFPPLMSGCSCFMPVLRNCWPANWCISYSSLSKCIWFTPAERFQGLQLSASLCLFFLSFVSFWRSSFPSVSSFWCVGCSQAWRRGRSIQQPQSSEQRRQSRRGQQQHQELRDGRKHQPEKQHQRKLSGATGGRAPIFSCLHPTSGCPRRRVHLLPRVAVISLKWPHKTLFKLSELKMSFHNKNTEYPPIQKHYIWNNLSVLIVELIMFRYCTSARAAEWNGHRIVSLGHTVKLCNCISSPFTIRPHSSQSAGSTSLSSNVQYFCASFGRKRVKVITQSDYKRRFIYWNKCYII